MKAREAARESLRLLSPRDRRRLGLAVVAQMAIALLDVVGVMLIGLVAALGVAIVQGTGLPPALQTPVDLIGLRDVTLPGLMAIAGGIAAATLFGRSLLSLLVIRRTLKFLARCSAKVSGRLAAAMFSRPILQVQEKSSQRIAYILTSGSTAAIVQVLSSMAIGLSELALLCLLGGALLLVDPVVTLVAIAYFAAVALVLHRILGNWAMEASKKIAEADIASMALAQEAVASYREITVLHRRMLYRARVEALRAEAGARTADTQFIAALPKYLMEAALVFGTAMLTVVELLTSGVESAVGTLALFLAAGTRVLPSILRLQGAATAIRSVAGGAHMVYAFAREVDGIPDQLEDPPSSTEIRSQVDEGHAGFTPTVEMRDVHFAYPDSKSPAASGVSLAIGSGQSLALVGSTGAGKSTVADLILGVLEPEEGSVLVGGVPPLEAVVRWTGGLAYVPQDVALANGTVRDNVALGLPLDAIDDDRVWEALERAQASSFLAESREGLDTIIGERGVRLSGGQRQRLGVARALYTRPKLLVMDEATSALDAETEHAITKMLGGLAGEVTTVTIAHRLATVRQADLVVYMEDGHVVASGSFDSVRASVPRFRRQAELLGV